MLVTMNERFWSKVNKSTECWEWNGKKNWMGYGKFKLDGFEWQAHRFAYFEANALVSSEKVIDHLCRNRGCVRPSHLQLVTQRTNVLRGIGFMAINAQKTHCKRGHEFSPENTYLMKRAKGVPGRRCRKCQALGAKARA
jgi:hypothetical protein